MTTAIATSSKDRKNFVNVSSNQTEVTFAEVKTYIEDAITTLVNRKARADDENIIKMLQKRRRVQPQTTEKVLLKLVTDGKILKDNSRSGGVKYRIASRVKQRKKREKVVNTLNKKSNLGQKNSSASSNDISTGSRKTKGYVINTAELTRMIYACLIRCQNPAVGVHLRAIEKFISSNYQGVLLRKHVKMALKRAINNGKIQKIDKLYYKINKEAIGTLNLEIRGSLINHQELDRLVFGFIASHPQGVLFKEIVKEVSNEHSGALLARYIRRSLDQAIHNGQVLKNADNRYVVTSKRTTNIDNNSLKGQITGQTYAENCYLCLQGSSPILDGQEDVTITCSDCKRKVHPSCLGYNPHLIAKILASDRWQCNDCKICFVCKEAGSPHKLLLCDACDKGCHLECANPQLNEPPQGQWICHYCREGHEEKTAALYNNISTYASPSNDGYYTESSAASNFQSKYIVPRRIIDKLTAVTKDFPEPVEWKVSDVALVFQQLGFGEHSHVFLEQEIDGKALFLLNRSDVISSLGLKLGPALKIFSYVDVIQSNMKASGIPVY